MSSNPETIRLAAQAIQARTKHKPTIGLVLGSGLSELADNVQNPDIIPYSEIPGWPTSTVVGHSGRLLIGQLDGQTVLVQQGRAHFYEGYALDQIVLPVRVMHQLGIKTLIVTNAAGGINTNFSAGDLMMITADHGCDPTWRGTDHTRERVPILGTGPGLQPSSIGVRPSGSKLASSMQRRSTTRSRPGKSIGRLT